MGQTNMQHDICTDLHNYAEKAKPSFNLLPSPAAITIQARTRHPAHLPVPRHEDLRTCS